MITVKNGKAWLKENENCTKLYTPKLEYGKYYALMDVISTKYVEIYKFEEVEIID